ncbi:MAG: flagellar biosynthetic protein FliR [Muribaculaceae bacterium]|nr:flagellar biosynthetic protein FliR [Roseburia sp.]MCM1431061.1 flagellar biosynthetic protein FliR [Muribaculaceae bacterium]MCM1493321.1 flagellar biosynthetic protein FliR [Muribaculaceae bacterium]
MVNYAFTLDNFEYWLLILVRLVSFISIAPFFGHSGVPNRTKAGFAVFVSFIIYNVAQRPELDYVSVVGYGVVVLSEGITGLLLGLAANICNSIILFAGSVIDMDIGLSMATEFNPDMGSETTITGNLYYYLVLLLLMTSNLQGYLIRAISDSFTVIPIGNSGFNWEHLMNSMLQYMGDLFVLGFRIFLPFFACIMILNCVLGIMAKVAPQMNMFAVGMQLKILVGYAVLFLTIFLLPNVADMILSEIKTMVVRFAEGMY